MARPCAICTHKHRAEIDKALVEGMSFRNISRRYGMSIAAVSRHKAEHLPADILQAKQAGEVARADDLLAQIRDLKDRAILILMQAERSKSYTIALGAIRETRQTLKLLGKISGELDERPQLNILVSPAWISIRDELVKTLAPFPQARAAVAERLLALEANDAGD